MAKGTDSNEFMVHSRVRTGLKREFAFAMKAQSEIDGSLGRTRGGSKNRNEPPVRVSPVGKRAKKTGSGKVVEDVGGGGLSEEEAKSDVVDLGSDDEPKNLESVFETVIDEKTVLDEPRLDKGMHEMEIEIESVKPNVSETLETLEEPKEEECNLDVKGGNVKKKKVALEKPVRRFTRSALKEKEEETKVLNDIVVGIDDDVVEKEATEVLPVMATPMPRKLNKSSKRFPIKLKDLLATGILEGLKVKYIKGQKVRKPGENDFRGVVKDAGVLCFCGSCKGVQVVTPTVFELHAGSANKRPPEYTYLENGKNLREVMNACSSVSLDILDEAVQMVLGDFTMQKSTICFNCREVISESSSGVSKLVCHSCMELKDTQVNRQSATTRSKNISSVVQPSSPEPVAVSEPLKTEEAVPKSLNTEIVVPNSSNTDAVVPNSLDTEMVVSESSNTQTIPKASNTGMKQSASRGKSRGKITRKDLRLHKLVFEDDVLPDGTEVGYYSHGKKLLVGYKKGYGIFCTCCNAEVSASQFEAHAGWSSRRKP